MFTTTREQGSRRRSRGYGVNKPARSSKLSLLSAFTETSTGSNGSSSTVTQESYSRSKHDSDRRKSSSSRRKRPRENKAANTRQIDGLKQSQKIAEEVDVFAFLVKDDGDDGESPDSTSNINQSSPVYDSDPECFYRSHHSDSGISMGDGSLEGSFIESISKRSLPPLLEERQHSESESHPTDFTRCDSSPIWTTRRIPQYCIEEEDVENESPIAIHVNSTKRQSRRGQRLQYSSRNSTSSQTSSAVSSPDVDQPDCDTSAIKCFRTFEHTSSRLLLQMQDDIAQLEEELAEIDAGCDSLPSAGVDGSDQPKKIEPVDTNDSHPRSSKSRRAEIYQELHFRIKQYQKALLARQQIREITRHPSPDESETYLSWLHDHVSPPSRLGHLLGSGCDLATFRSVENRRPSSRGIRSATTDVEETIPPRVLAMLASVNALGPLLSFVLVRTLLYRLILLIASIGAGALALENLQISLQRIHLYFIMALSSVVLVAAVLL